MNSIDVFSAIGFLVVAGFWACVSGAVAFIGFFTGLDCGHIFYGPGWKYKKRLLWYIPLVLAVLFGWYILSTICPFEISLINPVAT